MKRKWQLQEAKNRLSEVVNAAISGDPQTITRRGVETAVVISYQDYKRLLKPLTGLVDFFRVSPLCDVEIDLERNTEPSREVDL